MSAENEVVQAKEGAAGNPIVIALLNFFFPGVGSLVMGQKDKGIVLIVFTILLILPMWIPIVNLVFILLNVIYRVIYAIDGFQVATKAQSAGQVGAGECWHAASAFLPKLFLKEKIFVEGA